MKKFSQIFEQSNTLDIVKNSLSYISAPDLKKYLEVCDKFIGPDSKWIINWLIDHNDEYVQMLGKESENALANFYRKGKPSNKDLQELYDHLSKVIKTGRKMEIPTFMTKSQFNDIIDKKVAPDLIILDLDTEKGRSAVTKKYQPLIYKIVKQWIGKSSLDYDSLVSSALEGFTNALNNYGKKNHDNTDDNAVVGTTFGQYAAYMIRNMILADIQNVSHTVRIPISAQKKEREQKGHNTKNNTVSGDKTVGHSPDDGDKTLFDFIDGSENLTGDKLDKEDVDKLWDRIFKEIKANFDEKTFEIWCSINGLNGFVDDEGKPFKNKDLAKKYGFVPSNINYYCFKVNQFIQKNPKMMKLFTELYSIMQDMKANQN